MRRKPDGAKADPRQGAEPVAAREGKEGKGMTEQAHVLTKVEERGAPASEELSSATDVMLAMMRAAKGLRIYLPNNPVLIRFLGELNAKMTAHIGRYGELELDVEPFALRYRGTEVYQNRDPKESLAFRVHSDGVRALLFREGIEPQEMAVFVSIVSFEQREHQDDDVVTQLWERNLPHVGYVLEEDFIEGELEEETEPEPQQETISRIYAALAEAATPAPRTVPKQLLMLTRDEATWLRKAKQAEVYRNCTADVINILSAIVSGSRDLTIFTEFVEIMTRLAVSMVYSAEFPYALKLVRFLDQSLKDGVLPGEQRQVIVQSLAGIMSDRTVQVLQELVDSGDAVSQEDLRELLQILGLPSLAGICDLLGRVEKLKMRKVIVEVLVELGRDKPQVFAPFLSDPRWYLVRNLVLVLSLLETPAALEMIVGLITHKEQRIRKEVLGFLERSPDAKAKTYILKYLRDESSALRIRALQILARERLPFALKPALALTAAEDFKGKDLAEKKATFEAIGELGGDQVLPLFRDMLLKKRWFQREVDKERAVCAVAGLLKIRTPAAQALLEEARRQRSADVRGVIEKTLAAPRGSAARRGGS
jgi:HEAT repeat protein